MRICAYVHTRMLSSLCVYQSMNKSSEVKGMVKFAFLCTQREIPLYYTGNKGITLLSFFPFFALKVLK